MSFYFCHNLNFSCASSLLEIIWKSVDKKNLQNAHVKYPGVTSDWCTAQQHLCVIVCLKHAVYFICSSSDE